jgi:hypothetical protein
VSLQYPTNTETDTGTLSNNSTVGFPDASRDILPSRSWRLIRLRRTLSSCQMGRFWSISPNWHKTLMNKEI